MITNSKSPMYTSAQHRPCSTSPVRCALGHRTLRVFVMLSTIILTGLTAHAQSSYYHADGIVLDDGAGHTITLLPPTSGSGGIITLPASGLTWPGSNLVGALTNNGSGGLSWSPIAGVYLPLAGGTMSGAIAMGGNNITGAGTISGNAFTGGSAGVTTLDVSGATTLTALGTVGVVHANASGVLSTAKITDADVSNSAGIQYSKLTGTPTSLPPSGSAGGALSGTYPNPTLAAGSVTTGKIANGSITDIDISSSAAIQYSKFAAPSALPPSGLAGGVLSGTYPNPVVANNSVTSDAIADGTITNTNISTSAAISYAKLNLAGSLPISALSATGTPSATTFLCGDNTWSPAGLVIPYAPAALTTSAPLFQIIQTGSGHAIVGETSDQYFGVQGYSDGSGTAVLGEANASSSGYAIAANVAVGGTGLPVHIDAGGNNPTDVSSTNWSITHDGKYHADGSQLTNLWTGLAFPYSAAASTAGGTAVMFLGQIGSGNGMFGQSNGSGPGITGWAEGPSTGSGISAVVNGPTNAVPIEILNTGSGNDIQGAAWRVDNSGDYHGTGFTVISDLNTPRHRLTPLVSTQSASISGNTNSTLSSVSGSDQCGSITLSTSGAGSFSGTITLSFNQAFGSGTTVIPTLTVGPVTSATPITFSGPRLSSQSTSNFTFTYTGSDNGNSATFVINYMVVGVQP